MKYVTVLKIKFTCLLFISQVITACSSMNYPIARDFKVNQNFSSISYTADLRGTHIINKNGTSWVCMEPSPDAAFSYDEQEGLSLSLVNLGEKEGEDFTDGSDDLPMAGRASYVLLARELNYRICEIAVNTNASFDQYYEAYKANLDVIKEIALIEAKNITHSTKVNISTGSSSSLSFAENASTEIAGAEDDNRKNNYNSRKNRSSNNIKHSDAEDDTNDSDNSNNTDDNDNSDEQKSSDSD